MSRNSIFLICFIIFYLILFNILNYVKIKIKSLKGITMANKLNIIERQKLTQSLKLSQMMKLSINILKMSVMDLKNFIEKEFSKFISSCK